MNNINITNAKMSDTNMSDTNMSDTNMSDTNIRDMNQNNTNNNLNRNSDNASNIKRDTKKKNWTPIQQQERKCQIMRDMWANGDAKRDEGLMEPEELTKLRNIRYSQMEPEAAHLMDIYYPEDYEELGGKKYPLIVSIHGGGWFYGDKELYKHYCMHLATFGFAVVNFNYRLAPTHKYPAAFTDVCMVMDFLARNADAYRLDMQHLFMVGDSAGAQLCSQYCVWATNAEYRKNFNAEKYIDAKSLEIAVPCRVALNCGIYDMHKMNGREEFCNWYLPLDMEEDSDLGRSFYDVIDMVTSDFPETYLMSSVNDPLQVCTTDMVHALTKAGVSFVQTEFGQNSPEDAHVFHLNLRSLQGQKCNLEEIDFFTEKCLK